MSVEKAYHALSGLGAKSGAIETQAASLGCAYLGPLGAELNAPSATRLV